MVQHTSWVLTPTYRVESMPSSGIHQVPYWHPALTTTLLRYCTCMYVKDSVRLFVIAYPSYGTWSRRAGCMTWKSTQVIFTPSSGARLPPPPPLPPLLALCWQRKPWYAMYIHTWVDLLWILNLLCMWHYSKQNSLVLLLQKFNYSDIL